MKLKTDFWSEEKFEFDKLMYIQGNSKQIMFEADLNSVWSTYRFFKDIEAFVKTRKVRKTLFNDIWKNQEYYQFAVVMEGKIIPVKWFDLIIDANTIISHDFAFDTTLVQKNNRYLSFGAFPMHIHHKKLPLYREFNIRSRAYKYIANEVKRYLKN